MIEQQYSDNIGCATTSNITVQNIRKAATLKVKTLQVNYTNTEEHEVVWNGPVERKIQIARNSVKYRK